MIRTHIGSTIAIVLGVGNVLTGLAKPGPALITGVVILLGALAYRSAKKRKLGDAKPSLVRKILEALAIIVAMAAIFLQNNLLQAIESDPVPNLIIPVWILVAYVAICLRSPGQLAGSDTEETSEP